MNNCIIIAILISLANTTFAEDQQRDKSIPEIALKNWRTLIIKYKEGPVVYFLSGDLRHTDQATESGDGWIGTGTVLGMDLQSRITIMASYINSKKNGFLLTAAGDNKVREVNLSKWRIDEKPEGLLFILNNMDNGTIKMNGEVIEIKK